MRRALEARTGLQAELQQVHPGISPSLRQTVQVVNTSVTFAVGME